MTPARKEKCTIRHTYDAMNRIEGAGLIAELLKDQPGSGTDAYHLAYMDFIMETVEIVYPLQGRQSPTTVTEWIEPKRDALLAELQQRGLDQSADARHAVRKIDAVLKWVDDWESLWRLQRCLCCCRQRICLSLPQRHRGRGPLWP
jgi:hypothetical protein